MTEKYSVLIVEDEPVIARFLADCVSRNKWFTVGGVAATEHDAIHLADRVGPDLVLLDLGLSTPLGGFDVWRALHSLDKKPDVIAVTAAHDKNVMDDARKYGVLYYIVKPFTRATIAARLTDFIRLRRSLAAAPDILNQEAIIQYFGDLHKRDRLPPGLLPETLAAIVAVLRAADLPQRAEVIADRVGLVRETANRYLIYLVDEGIADRFPERGRAGHPAYLYRLASMWYVPLATSLPASSVQRCPHCVPQPARRAP